MLSEGLFIQNYYPGQGSFPLGHTWSLAVEEHFYIALTILLTLCLKKPSLFKHFVSICLVSMIGILALRFAGAIGVFGHFYAGRSANLPT